MNARTLGLIVLIPTVLALTACGIDRRQDRREDRREDRRDDRQSQNTQPVSQPPLAWSPALPQRFDFDADTSRA